MALFAMPVLAAAAGDDSGLPQFDPSFYPTQLFWLLVTFTLLYVLMAYVALPAVRRTQDDRAAAISAELTAAQAANDAAKNMMAQYEKALAEARAKAHATVSGIATKAAQDAAAEQAEQHHQLVQHIATVESNIAAARDAAIRDVRDTAFDLASAIVEKMIRAKLNPISAER